MMVFNPGDRDMAGSLEFPTGSHISISPNRSSSLGMRPSESALFLDLAGFLALALVFDVGAAGSCSPGWPLDLFRIVVAAVSLYAVLVTVEGFPGAFSAGFPGTGLVLPGRLEAPPETSATPRFSPARRLDVDAADRRARPAAVGVCRPCGDLDEIDAGSLCRFNDAGLRGCHVLNPPCDAGAVPNACGTCRIVKFGFVDAGGKRPCELAVPNVSGALSGDKGARSS
jgi:hypothetical protein